MIGPWGNPDLPELLRRASLLAVTHRIARNAAAFEAVVQGQGVPSRSGFFFGVRDRWAPAKRAVQLAAEAQLRARALEARYTGRAALPAQLPPPRRLPDPPVPLTGSGLEDKPGRRERAVRFYSVPLDPQARLEYVHQLRRSQEAL